MKNTLSHSAATRCIAIITAMGVFSTSISSCSNMSDSALTQTQGAAAGALSGAAVGALIGYLAKKDSKGALIGAGIGAGVGLFAGYFYGYKVARDKEAYATQEDYLMANIAALDSQITSAKNYNSQLQLSISLLKSTKSKLTATQQANMKKECDHNLSMIDQNIRQAELASQSTDADSAAKLRDKIKKLKVERNKLSQAAADLNNYT